MGICYTYLNAIYWPSLIFNIITHSLNDKWQTLCLQKYIVFIKINNSNNN